METKRRLFKLADLASLTRNMREMGQYTDNFPVPQDENALDKIVMTMATDYLQRSLPSCEVVSKPKVFEVKVPAEVIDKITFLENAIYMHHYTSPVLANYLSEFTYLMSNFDRNDNSVAIKFRRDMSNMYTRHTLTFSHTFAQIPALTQFLSTIDQVFTEHKDKIEVYIRGTEERKERLQRIQQTISSRKPYAILKQQADKTKEKLQAELRNIDDKIVSEEIGEIPVGTKLRVIKVRSGQSYNWYVYPPSPSTIPDNATVVSDNETLTKVIKDTGRSLYITSSAHVCEFEKALWDKGLISIPSDRVYYDPTQATFYVVMVNGETFPFSSFSAVNDFVTSTGLNIDLSEVHIKEGQEKIKTYKEGE